MQFFFEAMGIKQASARFTRMGASAVDLSMTYAWEEILALFFEIEEATFQGQGRRGGGSWKRDSPEWLARKTREGLDPRINHATQALRDAMTQPNAPGQVVREYQDRLVFGSDLPQAGPSQRNRPFIKLLPNDRLRMRRIITHHFVNAWREAV